MKISDRMRANAIGDNQAHGKHRSSTSHWNLSIKIPIQIQKQFSHSSLYRILSEMLIQNLKIPINSWKLTNLLYERVIKNVVNSGIVFLLQIQFVSYYNQIFYFIHFKIAAKVRWTRNYELFISLKKAKWSIC